MTTKPIKSESELIEILQEGIIRSEKQGVKILAGHLPLIYMDECPGKRYAELGVNRWGKFSTYSFELGCRLARDAIDRGKKTGLMVIVDDLVEVPRNSEGQRKVKSWMTRAQRRVYQANGVPEEYARIAKDYGVQDNIIEQERSFGHSELISEWKLKSQAIESGIVSPNECSLAYNAILGDISLFDSQKDYLIGFIPGQCKGNICAGVLGVRKDLDASHVFFPHIEIMGGFFYTGSEFIKAGVPASIKEIYESGGINYVGQTK